MRHTFGGVRRLLDKGRLIDQFGRSRRVPKTFRSMTWGWESVLDKPTVEKGPLFHHIDPIEALDRSSSASAMMSDHHRESLIGYTTHMHSGQSINQSMDRPRHATQLH